MQKKNAGQPVRFSQPTYNQLLNTIPAIHPAKSQYPPTFSFSFRIYYS